jgi:hypothetical protein
MKRRIAISFGLLFAACAFALDLGLDVTAEAALPSNGSSTAGVEERAYVGIAIGEKLYAKLELSHSTAFLTDAGFTFSPSRSDLIATVEYLGDWGNVGLSGAVRGPADGVTLLGAPRDGCPGIGVFTNASLPVVGDVVALEGGIRVVSDFRGVYGWVRLAPTLYLPLARPLMIDVGATLAAAAGNYDNRAYDGLASLDCAAELVVGLDSGTQLGLAGGYVLDLSAGRFSQGSSCPYFEATVSVSLEAE